MTRPPRLAEAVLAELIADPRLQDDVLGDLAEEFELRREAFGPAAAAAWYWGATAASTLPLAAAALGSARGRSWVRGSAGAAVGFVAVVALLEIGNLVLRDLGGPAESRIGLLVPKIISIGFGAASGVIAGWISAMVASVARLACATALAVLLLALNLIALWQGAAQGPTWYWVGFGLALWAGVVAGGLLRVYWRR